MKKKRISLKMGYGKKPSEKVKNILRRIKDTSTLIPGNSYHLRKKLKQEGSVITDEVHEIILKELKDGFLVEQDTDAKFSATEFEIFIRE